MRIISTLTLIWLRPCLMEPNWYRIPRETRGTISISWQPVGHSSRQGQCLQPEHRDPRVRRSVDQVNDSGM